MGWPTTAQPVWGIYLYRCWGFLGCSGLRRFVVSCVLRCPHQMRFVHQICVSRLSFGVRRIRCSMPAPNCVYKLDTPQMGGATAKCLWSSVGVYVIYIAWNTQRTVRDQVDLIWRASVIMSPCPNAKWNLRFLARATLACDTRDTRDCARGGRALKESRPF